MTRPLSIYCTCGAVWEMTKTPLNIYSKMLREFAKAHNGAGHRITDTKTAANARRRAERALPEGGAW